VDGKLRKFPHSTRFSGGSYQCSSKAARSEDLQVEHPIRCGYSPPFDFHPTLPRMHSSPWIRDQVVQVCQPRQKRLLAAAWMVKCFHHKQFPGNGIMRLIKPRAGDRHLRVFEDSLPPRFLGLKPALHARTIDLPGGVGDVIGKAA